MSPDKTLYRHFPFLSFMLLVWSTASAAQTAVEMKLTMYDDGRSCPAACDAHVVFHPANNGTPNAYLPGREAGTYQKCIMNEACTICFDAGPQSCMPATYRGNGPHKNTFDFTPVFYERHCAIPNIPTALATQCASLRAQAKKLEGRINCIKEPVHSKCVDIMAEANQKQVQDRPLYEACLELGEARFNSSRPVAEHRTFHCAYEKKGTGGPNSKGKRWKKLLPAACRENTFAGRDGLDCCSGSLFHDGPLNLECRDFYQQP